MEDLKMLCPDCNGNSFLHPVCTCCNSERWIYPPQEILNAIECDRIECKLFKAYEHTEIAILHELGFYNVGIPNSVIMQRKYFEGKTKLEALQKAEKWLDGRGKSE